MGRVTTGRRPLPGDLVRAAVVASVVIGVVAFGGVAGALFFLVLGGALVPRFLRLPATLDVCFGSSLLLAAWAAQLAWYDAVPWLDLLMHTVCTGLIAAVAVIALARGRMLELGTLPGRARAGLVVTTTGLGALSAVAWEFGEWAGNTYLDPSITVGYTDTVTDLAVGLVGAAVAGVVLASRDHVWRLPHDV